MGLSAYTPTLLTVALWQAALSVQLVCVPVLSSVAALIVTRDRSLTLASSQGQRDRSRATTDERLSVAEGHAADKGMCQRGGAQGAVPKAAQRVARGRQEAQATQVADEGVAAQRRDG